MKVNDFGFVQMTDEEADFPVPLIEQIDKFLAAIRAEREAAALIARVMQRIDRDIIFKKQVDKVSAATKAKREAAGLIIQGTQGHVLKIIWNDHGVPINDKMDVFQNVMFEFFRNIQDGTLLATHDGEVVNFLKILTRHRCTDHVRGVIRRQETSMEVVEVDESGEETHPDILHILMKVGEPGRTIYARKKLGDTFRNLSEDLNLPYADVRRIFFEVAEAIERLWQR